MKTATMNGEYEILTATDAPHVYPGRTALEEMFTKEELWPPYIAHCNASQVYSGYLDELFPSYQFVVMDSFGSIVGAAHSAPLSIDLNNIECFQLPNQGWEWAIKKSVCDFRQGSPPNALCALSITVRRAHMNHGLGSRIVQMMIEMRDDLHYSNLIAPVRPPSKCNVPFESMTQFLLRRSQSGVHQDGWLRLHERLGGRSIGPCNESMRVSGTLKQWHEWTGLLFDVSGQYKIPGGLAPLIVNVNMNCGLYIEPNVWVVYCGDTFMQ